MSAELKNALTELDDLMGKLKKSVARVPVRRAGFKRLHDKAARTAATLSVELTYAARRLGG